MNSSQSRRTSAVIILLFPFLFAPIFARSNRLQSKDQKDQDVVKIHADLVSVLVTVSDSKGDFVKGMARDDFSIYEDGVLQEIRDFRDERDSPLSIAFLYDTSGSLRPRRDFEKRAAAHFFKAVFRPQDQGALLSVNTDVIVEQDLTNSMENLSTHALALEPKKGATSLYDAVFLASGLLRNAAGRRAILILSDGRDTTSHVSFNEALRMAQEKDVVIYVVVTTGEVRSANIRDPGAENAMRTFAEQTGGHAYFPESEDEFEEIFSRLAAALHAQYLLTYYSTNEARDGRFRVIDVKLGPSGLTPHTRKGYYAPKDD